MTDDHANQQATDGESIVPRWRVLLDKHFREFAAVMLFFIGIGGSYLGLKADGYFSTFGDKRWLQLVTYERDRAVDSTQRQLERQSDLANRVATDKELANIKAQGDRTQLAIERAQLETKDAFNRMADLIEKLRERP